MNTTTNTVRELAWDGPLGVVASVLLGLGILALITWMLSRERGILGERHFWLFWILRAIALGAALWMLLAPSQVTIQRTTIRQSLVIASDVSQSMRTIDKPDTADDLRWSIASSASVEAPAIVAADRGVLAAAIAGQHLRHARRLAEQHRPGAEVLHEAAAATRALRNTKTHLESVAKESRSKDPSRALLRLLDDEAFHEVARAAATVDSGREASAVWRDSLDDAIYHVTSLSRRLGQLARQVRQEQSQILSVANATQLASLRKEPRISRVAAAIQSLQQTRLDDQDESAVIKFCTFDSSASAVANQASPSEALRQLALAPKESIGQSTDLAASLEQIRQSEQSGNLAAIILYSDALQTAPTSVRKKIEGLTDTQVYVVPIGNPKHVRDVSVQSVTAPSVVMKDDNMVVEADIQAYDCAGETCMVELVHGDVTVAHQAVEIDDEVIGRRVRFDTRLSELGRERFSIRLASMDGELTSDNNSESFEVNVVRGKIGVMLADQFPRWEYRYLAQLFRRDAKIESDELLIEPRLIATGAREESKTFPTSADEWSMYDAVILGDVSSEHLNEKSQQSLIDYLRNRGGTLVMIAGSEFMPAAYANQPLESILPVTKVDRENRSSLRDGFALQVTDAGNRHPALMIGEDRRATQMAWDFINRNAPANWLSPFRKPRTSARTLISAVPRALSTGESMGRSMGDDEEAFLCWQPVGRGRIVYLAGPETYRLRFLRGDRFHYRLWGQVLRWAIASDLSEGSNYVRLRTGKARYDENETIVTSVELTDIDGKPVSGATLSATAVCEGKPPAITAMSPDRSVPGRYVGSFDSLSAGEYELRVDGQAVTALMIAADAEPPAAHFLVRPFVSREQLDTRCDLVLAQQIADATGGQVLPPTAVAEVLELTDLNPIVTEETEMTPLWIRWELLLLLVGCMSTEWVIRKIRGLS